MNKLFRRWLKNRTQGDEEKELFWWDLFFNYEVVIGFVIATILSLVVFIVTGVFSGFANDFSRVFNFQSILIVIGIGLLIGGFIAMVIVSPLNNDDNTRKNNIKQGSFYWATALGHIANIIVNWAPLLVFVVCFSYFKLSTFFGACVGVALYYLLLSLVKPNAKDYVNWRFAWAIDNYDSLYSRHYKWWTSAAQMEVQKFHLKKFQSYKYHAALSLIMIPVLFPLLLNGSGAVMKGNKKAAQVEVTADSISVAPDSAENIIEENNEEIDLLGSEGEDVIAFQEEPLNEDTQSDEYYEESSSQPSSSNAVSDKAESKPLKTESSNQPRERVNAESPTQAREEKPAASQVEQKTKANSGPEFQGGNYALTSYIARHLHYPPEAAANYIQGKVVVKLTISATGQVTNVELVQSVDDMLDAEALRLCKSLPRFVPARRNGQPVVSTMTIPINFRL